MTVFAALLRAVNVGGHGKLAMADLVRLCAEAGFADARTHIASGNVVFRSDADEAGVKQALEARLLAFTGAAIVVFVRDLGGLQRVLADNPFSDAPGNRVTATFLDADPPEGLDRLAAGRNDEEIAPGERVIYIHYPSGIGGSRLRLAPAQAGTARNMNTVARLAAMAGELAG